MRSRLALLLLPLLAACAGRPAVVADLPPPAPVPVVEAPPAPTPANAGLSAAATLWHLRAGLNVAALACRGPDEAAIIAGYNGWLARHAADLAAARLADADSYRAAGGDWQKRYDDDQTRLYNFFGQSRGRSGFCRAASEALAADDGDLPVFATARLPLLDAPFAPPRLAVDARVFDATPTVAIASR